MRIAESRRRARRVGEVAGWGVEIHRFLFRLRPWVIPLAMWLSPLVYSAAINLTGASHRFSDHVMLWPLEDERNGYF